MFYCDLLVERLERVWRVGRALPALCFSREAQIFSGSRPVEHEAGTARPTSVQIGYA
jgi:hypothetical protein